MIWCEITLQTQFCILKKNTKGWTLTLQESTDNSYLSIVPSRTNKQQNAQIEHLKAYSYCRDFLFQNTKTYYHSVIFFLCDYSSMYISLWNLHHHRANHSLKTVCSIWTVYTSTISQNRLSLQNTSRTPG